MNFEIQQLIVPKDCQVIKNDFTTYDPETEYSEKRSLYNLAEDLLQIEFRNSNIVVDLGWYGDFETNDGCFKIIVLKNDDWDSPLRIETSKSQRIITEKLEQILIGINKMEI
ncbi:hypothetical protein [Flavobacterium polysaccharolyticum]|uniref:Uncharacterized protein n=1 Tax=Flavobacterium polysaccharolyticum TaxID=3133148 RepID=A0ABU9NPN8_9FLAO